MDTVNILTSSYRFIGDQIEQSTDNLTSLIGVESNPSNVFSGGITKRFVICNSSIKAKYEYD